MSHIISSEIRVSVILSQLKSPLIFLRSPIDVVGYAFGMGIAISSFQMSGLSPYLMHQLNMLTKGSAKYAANNFNNLAGTSPTLIDFFALMLANFFQTWAAVNWGISLE